MHACMNGIYVCVYAFMCESMNREREREILPCTDVDEREGHQISASQVGSATKTIH